MRKKRLGDLLLEKGMVDELQLRSALGVHYKWGVPLGQVVVDKGFCTAQQVLELLAGQVHLPVVDLDEQVLDERLSELLPVQTAEACRVIPLRVEGPRDSVLVVAVAAPARPTALDEVARVTGKARVVAMLATDRAVSRAIDRLYYPHLIGAQRPVEPIELPEADENLPLVTDRSECLMLGHELQAANAKSTQERDGLPLMMPLAAELPAVRRAPKASVEREPEVWVYGWGAQATDGLVKLLEEEGLRVRVARTEDVVKASPRAVVLTPVQSVESVLRHGIKAQLLLAGRSHDRDRALALGAAFLAGPLRTDELIREVRQRMDGGKLPMRRAG